MNKIDPDDPRLTALALGELDPAEQVALERDLAHSPEARLALDEIRETTRRLSDELGHEPAPALSEFQRHRILAAAETAPDPADTPGPLVPSRRMPWLWPAAAAAAVVAAAGLLALGLANRWRPGTERATFQLAAGGTSAPPPDIAPIPAGPAQPTADRKQPATPSTDRPSPVPAAPDATRSIGRAVPADSIAPRETPAPLPTEPALGRRYGLRLPPGTPSPSAGAPPDANPPVSNPTPVTQQKETARSRLATRPEAEDGQDRFPTSPATTTRTAPLPTRASKQSANTQLAQRRTRPEAKREAVLDFGPAEGVDRATESSTPTPSWPSPTRPAEGGFRSTLEQPLSTFSVDVDTASYANVRRYVNDGQWPPIEAVRIEEMINYFPYDYPEPRGEHPFSTSLDLAPCPWNPGHRLVRIGLKGRTVTSDRRPPGNFVFLVDVSGSMQPPERLPLLKQALRQLARRINDRDRIAIVAYAGQAGLVLPSTAGTARERIFAAIDRLEAYGTTNGGQGIQQAYQVASAGFITGGVNRVLLCTDGDFNVGLTNHQELVRLIETKARSGVFLTTLGVGTDNFKDTLMQQLANRGNGNYHYLDSFEEAQKVLVDQMNANLVTIARDVKIQVEFNPALVDAYRLVGYEKRALANRDFHDDRKDAGEIGAGHTVTALYEIRPAGRPPRPPVDGEPLKYQPGRTTSAASDDRPANPVPSLKRESADRTGSRVPDAIADELLTLKLRYKTPDGRTGPSLEIPLRDPHGDAGRPAPDLLFAAAVAEFGMILRHSEHRGTATFDSVLELAGGAKGSDPDGHRAAFIELVEKARRLEPR